MTSRSSLPASWRFQPSALHRAWPLARKRTPIQITERPSSLLVSSCHLLGWHVRFHENNVYTAIRCQPNYEGLRILFGAHMYHLRNWLRPNAAPNLGASAAHLGRRRLGMLGEQNGYRTGA